MKDPHSIPGYSELSEDELFLLDCMADLTKGEIVRETISSGRPPHLVLKEKIYEALVHSFLRGKGYATDL